MALQGGCEGAGLSEEQMGPFSGRAQKPGQDLLALSGRRWQQ